MPRPSRTDTALAAWAKEYRRPRRRRAPRRTLNILNEILKLNYQGAVRDILYSANIIGPHWKHMGRYSVESCGRAPAPAAESLRWLDQDCRLCPKDGRVVRFTACNASQP